MATKESIAKAPERRVRRTPIGRRNVLTVEGRDPDYVYRVVNDTGNRVAQLQEQGYVIEDASAVTIGDKRVGNATPLGTSATVQVGQGVTGVVMKQRKDWYEEDQAAKQAAVQATEEATKQPKDGDYGEIKITRS
jgi:hypothetical protein